MANPDPSTWFFNSSLNILQSILRATPSREYFRFFTANGRMICGQMNFSLLYAIGLMVAAPSREFKSC